MALNLIDQQKSITRFITGQVPDVPVILEKSQALASAPAFLIEHVRSFAAPMTATAHKDTSYWKITYFTPDYWACKGVAGDLKAAFQSAREIPASLFDFAHPAPEQVAPAAPTTTGTLPAGTYRLQVTGLGRDNSESLPSPPVEVTLPETGAISLQIPRLELGLGTFRSYRVYLDDQLAAELPQDPIGNTTCTLTDRPAADAPAPPTASIVLERYFYIEDVQAVTFGDRDADGLFQGIVRLKNRLTMPRQIRVGEKVAHVSAEIAAIK